MPIIRDAEIEQLLRDYTAPILRAAGLAKQNIQVVIINDRAFNAFVMDGRHIFINAGALFDAKTPNEVIGVLAHETGHIAGGHLSRLREQLANGADRSRSSPCCSASARWSPARRTGGGGDVGAAAILGAAGDDPALAALLCARAGRPGRPRRREIPHRHAASRPRACSNRSSA